MMLQRALRLQRPSYQARALMLLTAHTAHTAKGSLHRRGTTRAYSAAVLGGHYKNTYGIRLPTQSSKAACPNSVARRSLTTAPLHAQHAQTICIPDVHNVDVAAICDCITPLPKTYNIQSNASLVLLVSKRLTHLLTNRDTFTSQVLQKLFKIHETVPRASVLAAVVDAVPRHERRVQQDPTSASAEGISLCIAPEGALFSLEDIESGNIEAEQSLHTRELKLDEQPPTLTFALRSHQRSSPEHCVRIMLPIAQTIFQANVPCVLQLSRWDVRDDQPTCCSVHPVTEGNVDIALQLAESDSSPPLSISMPLAQLTGPRTIKTVMGNVVRELTQSSTSVDPSTYGEIIGQEGGGDTSASKELEGAVAAFLGMGVVTVQPVAVWALVIPAALATSDAYHTLTRSTQMALEKLGNGATTQDDLLSLRRLLWEGASLRRVLSGGGGWGNKSGLLSLEPSSDYVQKKSEALFDLDGDDPMAFLRGVASPGDRLVFFVGIDPAHSAGVTDQNTTSTDQHNGDAVFGVIPSSADEVLIPNPSNGEAKVSPDVYSAHFGMLSESGLSVEIPHMGNSDGASTRSRIDVPFARLVARSGSRT